MEPETVLLLHHPEEPFSVPAGTFMFLCAQGRLNLIVQPTPLRDLYVTSTWPLRDLHQQNQTPRQRNRLFPRRHSRRPPSSPNPTRQTKKTTADVPRIFRQLRPSGDIDTSLRGGRAEFREVTFVSVGSTEHVQSADRKQNYARDGRQQNPRTDTAACHRTRPLGRGLEEPSGGFRWTLWRV